MLRLVYSGGRVLLPPSRHVPSRGATPIGREVAAGIALPGIHAPPARPSGWHYDRAELIADGIVHGIGVFGGVVAATVLIVLAAIFASTYEIVSVSVYAAGLLAMLGLSAAYNLWPVSRGKWRCAVSIIPRSTF